MHVHVHVHVHVRQLWLVNFGDQLTLFIAIVGGHNGFGSGRQHAITLTSKYVLSWCSRSKQ
jgi:hypothetical protein